MRKLTRISVHRSRRWIPIHVVIGSSRLKEYIYQRTTHRREHDRDDRIPLFHVTRSWRIECLGRAVRQEVQTQAGGTNIAYPLKKLDGAALCLRSMTRQQQMSVKSWWM